MLFPSLHSEVNDLRNALQVYVGNDALAEIGLRHPASSNDEASFLRLTSWCYALLFEAGRVSIPYLLKLPGHSGNASPKLIETMDNVHALRTFAFHNLGLSTRDVGVARRARDWYRDNCGTDFPKQRHQWARCFDSLCVDVSAIVVHCHEAVDVVLASTIDGGAATQELRRRLDSNWPRHKFSSLLEDVLVRLDVQMNVDAFLNDHLATWQNSLDYCEHGQDSEGHIVRIIERDVLNHFADVLPVDGTDILAMGVPQGPLVSLALNKAREYMSTGKKSRDELLQILKMEVDVWLH